MEIKGYSNYLIYPDGRVWSKNSNKFLKPGTDKSGYLLVSLSKDGKPKSCSIHRLVAEHYIPNPDKLPQVDHRYRDKTDNRVENLSWVTPLENCQNTGNYKNNTSGYKNIRYDKSWNGYRYTKTINKVKHENYFKTLK
jgi:hypothetical protein